MRTELEELHRERSSAKVVVTRLKSVLQSALSDNQVRGTCHRYGQTVHYRATRDDQLPLSIMANLAYYG